MIPYFTAGYSTYKPAYPWVTYTATIQEVEPMELENTDKKIMLENIAKELNWRDNCEVKHFVSLAKAILGNMLHPADNLGMGKGCIIPGWLKDHPEAVPWLISHGFAKEKKPEFMPFSIDVETQKESDMLKRAVGKEKGCMDFYERLLRARGE